MSNSISIDTDIKPLDPTAGEAYKEQLKLASREFESILVAQMLKVMRQTVPDVGLLGRSNERDIYEDMLHSELARSGAQGHGFGFGELIYQTLSRHVDDLIPSADEVSEQVPASEVNNE